MIEFSDEHDARPGGGARLRSPRAGTRTSTGGKPPASRRWTRSAMADLGLFGIVFGEEWGGSGGDFTSLCIAIEELGAVSQSLGITLSAAVGLGANLDPRLRHGRTEDPVAARSRRPAGASAPSVSRNPMVAATRRRHAPRRTATVTTGCWTGRRPSSRTPVRRSRP